MRNLPPSVAALREELLDLGWVSELFVSGSAATGDYVRGVSDLDLVAVTSGEVGPERRAALVALHRELDSGAAAGLSLGCVYVHDMSLTDLRALHPTWTHGMLVDRVLSGIARAELVREGYAVLGRAPHDVLAAMTDDDVRRASMPSSPATGRELLAARGGGWIRSWSTSASRPWPEVVTHSPLDSC